MRIRLSLMASLYETDYHRWTEKTAELLRSGRVQDVNLSEVAEEIESLGNSERRALTNHLVVLITHILKWEHQPSQRSGSWRGSIREQQRRIVLLVGKMPSLAPLLPGSITDAYPIAVAVASAETHIEEDSFPAICPYTWEQLRDYTPAPETGCS